MNPGAVRDMFRQPPTGGSGRGNYAMRALKLLLVIIVVLLLLYSYVIVGPGQRDVLHQPVAARAVGAGTVP